ncbi:MAG: hypothetical protein PHO18_07305, partial [Synergistaceae bacterium]|nr:hypothetical protein [Synergistaceae bacterium]
MKIKLVRKDLFILIAAVLIIFFFFFCGRRFAAEYLLPLIKHFDRIIRSAMIDLRSNMTFRKLIWFAGISFVYGIIHAAGPGHGKALFSAFFINRKGSIAQVLTAAASLVLTHTLVSVFITFLFISVLKSTDAFLKIRMQGLLMWANGLLILAVGLFLLFQKIIQAGNKEKRHQTSVNNSH